MGYNIEVSVNLLKHADFTNMEKKVREIAEICGCEHIYSFTDMDGTSKISRYHMIFVVTFPKINLENCSTFIKMIKSNKEYCIECIYEDNHICKLIYATNYYLRTIEKDKMENYKVFARKRSYSEDEQTILTPLL